MSGNVSQPKIRVMIVDDEAPGRARLRQMLKTEPGVEIVSECANGREALAAILRDKPDLAFFDVQMPGLNGLEVCEAAAAQGAAMPLVIFVTAYDEYALKAFEVHAIDYLLKPFDRERFRKALAHARQRLERAEASAQPVALSALLEDLRQGVNKTDRLVLKVNGRLVFLRTDNIDWIEADGNYVRIHAGVDAHYVRDTLTSLEERLPAQKFLRISRSSIVNLDRVKEMHPLFYGDYTVVLESGSKLNLSRNYRDRVEARLKLKNGS